MLSEIKICGIKDKTSLDACIALGIGFIGFNFVPQSPRYITPDAARILGQSMPESVAKVALIVNANDVIISDIIAMLTPDYLQLHGTESVERMIDLKQKFNIPLIKAVGIATQNDIDNAHIYFDLADMMLFDAKPTADNCLTGGLGKTFNWSLVNNLVSLKKPFMLAGGLNYHNLQDAKNQSNATYFDICSGVEVNKGEKSIALIQQLQNLKF